MTRGFSTPLPAGGPYTERGTGEFVTDPLHVAPSMELSALTTLGQGAPNSVADAIAAGTRGAVTFPHDLAGYRYYVINHELGHGLGFGHEECGAANGVAPAMVQQTLTLRNTDIVKLEQSLPSAPGFSASYTCQPNPWPNPENVTASTLPELPVSETP